MPKSVYRPGLASHTRLPMKPCDWRGEDEDKPPCGTMFQPKHAKARVCWIHQLAFERKQVRDYYRAKAVEKKRKKEEEESSK